MTKDECAQVPRSLALKGVEEFNRGEFFEQHETLEMEWRAESRPVRQLYQGILQVGLACYQIERGNWPGAPDGTIYVANGAVHAVAPNGSAKWVFRPSDGNPVLVAPSLSLDGAYVYVATERTLYALESVTSVGWWQVPVVNPARTAPVVGPDGIIYIPSISSVSRRMSRSISSTSLTCPALASSSAAISAMICFTSVSMAALYSILVKALSRMASSSPVARWETCASRAGSIGKSWTSRLGLPASEASCS